jgi:DNA invertase Pin-like site-specific DNA recombinase
MNNPIDLENITGSVTVGYIRESTEEQVLGTHALEQQRARLENFGIHESLIFCDVDSGAKTDRVGFTQLMNLVRQGKIKRIVATRWDRLTRSQELYLQFKKILQDFNVDLLLLDQGAVDLGTASGEFFADMQVLFAVQERRMIKERVKKGFEHRRNKLKASGRPPWGYLNDQDKYKLNQIPCICLLEQRPDNYFELAQEPDNSTQLIKLSRADIARDVVKIFFKCRSLRKTVNAIYQKYGVPRKTLFKKVKDKQVKVILIEAEELLFWKDTSGLKNWLINPVLEGHTAYLKFKRNRYAEESEGWDIRYDTHPEQAIISQEESTAIREILEFNSSRHFRSNATFYLTGLIFCGACGYKCILKRLCARNLAYYGCRHSSTGCTNRKCVRIEKIDQAIIRELFLRANQFTSESHTPKKDLISSPKIQELEAQLAAINQVPGVASNPLLKQAKQDISRQIKDLLNQCQQQIPLDATLQQIIAHPQARNINYWNTRTQQEREIFYSKLVERVVIGDGEILSVSLKI